MYKVAEAIHLLRSDVVNLKKTLDRIAEALEASKEGEEDEKPTETIRG